MVSTKKLSSTAVFNIDNKCKIGILERYLKDHATLKTGVMMLTVQLCITKINILKHIRIKCVMIQHTAM